MIFMRSF